MSSDITWPQFVKMYAKQHSLTYGQALKEPASQWTQAKGVMKKRKEESDPQPPKAKEDALGPASDLAVKEPPKKRARKQAKPKKHEPEEGEVIEETIHTVRKKMPKAHIKKPLPVPKKEVPDPVIDDELMSFVKQRAAPKDSANEAKEE